MPSRFASGSMPAGASDVALNLHNPSPGHRWQLTCFEMEVSALAICEALAWQISQQLTGARNARRANC